MSLLSYQKVTQRGITATVLSLLHVVQVLRNLKKQQDSGICPQPRGFGSMRLIGMENPADKKEEHGADSWG